MESLLGRPRFYDTSAGRSRFRQPLSIKQASKLAQKSQRCKSDNHAEPSWNYHVHMPMLEKSLKSSVHHALIASEIL